VSLQAVSWADSGVGLVPSSLFAADVVLLCYAAGTCCFLQACMLLFSPGFQCHDSRARHLHVVVSGGCWRGPKTHAFCVSHVSRAQVHVAVSRLCCYRNTSVRPASVVSY